jgi:PAS domain S-box-containing protein
VLDPNHAIVEAANIAGIGLAIFGNRNGDPAILFINDAACSIAGRTAEEVISQPPSKFISRESWARIAEHWDEFLTGELSTASFEIEVIHKQNNHIAVSISFSATMLESGPSIIAFLTNINERREAERALVAAKTEAEEVSRIKSNILSNFSHELRTPLHSILGFSALLEEEMEDQGLRDYASSIRRSGERLLSTVTSIIEIAALESTAGERLLYPHPIADVLEFECAKYESPIYEKGLRLQTRIPLRTQIILLDKDRFGKAFEKIISNALKFTHFGSITVELSTEMRPIDNQRPHEERVTIKIADTGIGMAPEFVETAFEKFKQESTGSNRSYEGTGLGLPLARSYIKQMNGEVALKSQLGSGTEVIMSFPVVGHLKRNSPF